jgi:hypothetical protein
MARRITKAESSLILLLIAIGLPIFLIVKFFEIVGFLGFLVPIAAIVGIVILVAVVRAAARKKRVSYLLAKYNNAQIVDRIMRKTIWVGQTCDQLIDCLGRPMDVDEKVFKTKRREIWKYAHRGRNRYGLRITVEDGAVAGWDEKL